MAIPWNEDDPRDAALLIQNLTYILRQAARQAHLRHPPTVSMAQEWHRQVYEGARLPVPYYAGEIRDSDSNFPELYGYPFQSTPHSDILSVPETSIQGRLAEPRYGYADRVRNL